jgi:hypothetical protein
MEKEEPTSPKLNNNRTRSKFSYCAKEENPIPVR